jgi:NADH:ubiquinone oxidoreductase subunit 2 (subunit N)
VPVVVEYEWFFPAGVFFLVGGLGVVFLVFGLVALLVGGLGGFALALSIDTNDENSEWDMGLLLSGVLTICCMGMRTFTLYPNRCNGPGLSLTA